MKKGQALGRDWTNLLSMTVNQSDFLFSVKPAGGFRLVRGVTLDATALQAAVH